MQKSTKIKTLGRQLLVQKKSKNVKNQKYKKSKNAKRVKKAQKTPRLQLLILN